MHRSSPAAERMIRSDGCPRCQFGHTVATMRPPALLIFSLCLVLSTGAAVAAQPSPSPSPSPSAVPYPCTTIISIVTRPSVTTSSCTVPARKVLIENGYMNTVTTGSSSGIAVTYPQSLLRIGSGYDKFEYEIEPPSVQITNFGGTIVRGATDMGAALKYLAGYTSNASWGVEALATLPSGSPAFTASIPQYTGDLNWTYTANSLIGFGGTLSFNSFGGTDPSGNIKRYFSFIPSIDATIGYPAHSQFYAEYAYFSQIAPGLGGRSLVDYGFIHDFGPRIQFDVESGVQPTTVNGQRLHYFGVGLSFMN